MTIGERIRNRRENLGMTQNDLAKILGYSSRTTITKIESGINDIAQSKILAIAKALKTTPAYLMGWEDEEGNNLLKNKPTGAGADLSLSEEEAALIAAYRAKSEMQNAVKTLLGLPQGTIGTDAANVVRSGNRAFAKKDIIQG